MEAVAGLSIAANVFQVIDFSSRLIFAALDAYDSGTPRTLSALEKLAQELQSANRVLDDTLATSSGQIPSSNDQAILKLAEDSNALAAELVGYANGSTKGSVFRSFCNGMKAVLSREKIEEKRHRLNELRDLVEYRIVLSLRSLANQHSSQLASLDTKTTDILQAIVASRFDSQNGFSQLGWKLDSHDEINAKRHDDILAAIRQLSIANPRFGIDTTKSIDQDLWQGDSQNTTAAKNEDIRHWLSFARKDARRDAISQHHAQTFEWIYHSAHDSSPGDASNEQAIHNSPSTSFPEWLLRGNGLYWIKGKAGSGKSTLMKMLSQDSRTHAMLKLWAQGSGLFFASFYFWYGGTEMQKTQIGLLRAILYDLLTADVDMARVAFPGWQSKYADSEPILEDVVPALARIMKDEHLVHRKICLFVDGLDEYQGDGIEMTDLAEFLRNLGQTPNVKILVSSRPLQPFEETFHNVPQLTLQDLTLNDIRKVVTESLYTHKRMAVLLEAHPERATQLTEGIADKSSGVFLWVILAVKAIKEGFQNHDGIDELEDRLAGLPPELDDMFILILRRIAPRYRTDAHIYLEIARRWFNVAHCAVSPITFLFAANMVKLESSVLDFPIGPLRKSAKTALMQDLDVKLKTRSLGLLEIGLGTVQFLHRSVYDFLQETSSWRTILSPLPPCFDVNESILEGYTVYLKTKKSTRDGWRSEVRIAMELHSYAETTTGRAQNKALDEIDKATCNRFAKERVRKVLAIRIDHWSDAYLQDSDDTHAQIKPWTSNFLSFTIVYACEAYLKQTLCLNSGRLPAKKGRPLLEYAVDSHPDVRTGVSPKIVEMLLEAGANPNERFLGMTPWTRALCSFVAVLRWHRIGTTWSTCHHQTLSLDIFSLLLHYGADKQARFSATMSGLIWNRDGAEEDTPSSILRYYLDSPCPCKGTENFDLHTITECSSSVATGLRAKTLELLRVIEDPSSTIQINFPNNGGPGSGENFDNGVKKGRKRERVSAWFARIR